MCCIAISLYPTCLHHPIPYLYILVSPIPIFPYPIFVYRYIAYPYIAVPHMPISHIPYPYIRISLRRPLSLSAPHCPRGCTALCSRIPCPCIPCPTGPYPHCVLHTMFPYFPTASLPIPCAISCVPRIHRLYFISISHTPCPIPHIPYPTPHMPHIPSPIAVSRIPVLHVLVRS